MIKDFDNIPELPAIMGPAKQIAYMVDDIDAAMQRWHDDHGVGPFLVTRNAVPLSNAFYRGEKAETTRVNIAFAYVGEMQLELIELIGDTPDCTRKPWIASSSVCITTPCAWTIFPRPTTGVG